MEIVHKPCPHPDCGSTDAFSYNTEGFGFCHSCGNAYPKTGVLYEGHWLDTYPLDTEHKRKGSTKVMKQSAKVAAQQIEILTKVFRAHRGITAKTMEFYGVPTLVDSEGTAIEQVYVYPDGGEKHRVLPKEFYTSNGLKSDLLFGMDKFNAGSGKCVTICEGELDAMSAFQMMGSKFPCVSLPSATPSKRIWEKVRDWLDSFEKIYVSFDSDGKSDHISTKLSNLFPNRVYKVPHDKYKDANEFLQANATEVYKNCWWSAKKFVPDDVLNSPEDFLRVYRETQDSTYYPTGIVDLDAKLLGLMQGFFTVFSAPEGIGKTELMRYLEYHILSTYPDVSIATCHLEETPRRGLLGLVSYAEQKNYTRKELIASANANSDVEAAIVRLTKDERLYQFSLGVDEDPDNLLQKIRYFKEACGCAFVFFEPIQDLGYSRHSNETLEQYLSGLSTKLARLATELNVGIISIAHENDDGEIRDCRMIGKRAGIVVRLARDKMSPDPSLKNLMTVSVTKNRPVGDTGFGGQLRFDPDSFTLAEAQD